MIDCNQLNVVKTQKMEIKHAIFIVLTNKFVNTSRIQVCYILTNLTAHQLVVNNVPNNFGQTYH